jgi:hypothetical protein
MFKYTATLALLILSAAISLAAQQNMARTQSWSGVIVNENCTADEAFAEAPKCTGENGDAKLALYDDTIRRVFRLEPQNQAAGHLGDAVTVEGAIDGDTIRVSSLKLLAGIGLPVGEKAPAFSAPDQFGNQQTLDTLKGPNGTVLLFFRSADW